MKVGVIVYICYLPSGLNDNLNPNLYKDFSGEKTYFFFKGLFTKYNSNLFSYVFLCTRRSCVAVE